MQTARISSSSYSNTAPLIWSFLYGSNRGKAEVIMDTAPARSAQLLAEGRVDAALVPVIAYQMIDGLKIVPGVCIGAKEKVKSVSLITKGEDLSDIKSLSLDISSKTSVALTKIIFREFLGLEPEWREAEPDIAEMLDNSDCALLIGDPALMIDESEYRVFDLASLWKEYTGYGFIFAMWMGKQDSSPLDFAAARDEGLNHLDEIISNYEDEIPLSRAEFREYLTQNISFAPDESMLKGLDLYFKLAKKHKLLDNLREVRLF